jgi:hypothetical protein
VSSGLAAVEFRQWLRTISEVRALIVHDGFSTGLPENLNQITRGVNHGYRAPI